MARQREITVFEALRKLGVARDGYWQRVAFSIYDDMAYDGDEPDADRLARIVRDWQLD